MLFKRAEGAVKGFATLARALETDDYSKTPRAIADILGLAMLPTGAVIPLAWAAKPLGYAINLAEGDAKPQHIGNVVSGVLTGRDGTE